MIEFAWLEKQESAGVVGLSLLQTVQKENCKPQSNRKAAISYQPTLHKNAVVHKRNENAVADGGRFNFPRANKFVTAEVRKVEIELAASV